MVKQKLYGIIYLLINKINKKMYIGQTITTFNKRINAHKRDSKKQNPKCLIDRKIKQYSLDNFEKYIIDVSYTNQEELNTLECHYIDYFQTNVRHNNGYNIKEGGSKGKPSEASKIKMSISHSNRKRSKHSSETIKKQSLIKLGDKNPMFGKKRPEHSKKLSKPIMCMETNIKFSSIIECSKVMSINKCSIAQHLKNNPHYKHAGGFTFSYI